MSIRGVAEAYLSQQRSTLWGRSYDLTQPTSFEDAAEFLEDVLRSCEEIMSKEVGWIEREHTEPAPVRVAEPNPFPIVGFPFYTP